MLQQRIWRRWEETMSEIKSTLDLVMERTRHLSLSAEEKASQQQAAYTKRLQGLLQQYADQAFSVADFKKRFEALQTEMGRTEQQVSLAALAARIDPDQDNARWLALTAQVAPAVCESLQSLLDGYRSQRSDLLAAGGQDQRDRLAREHGVSGTAVKPHPEQDPACRQRLETLRQTTLKRIAALGNPQMSED
jgi:hypothetical protein